MSARWPRRWRLLAGLAFALLVAAAVTDYAMTSAALPDFDPSFEFDPARPEGRDPAELERARLIDGYGGRIWLYVLGLLAVAVTLTVAALRASAPAGRGELFTDIGVAGVVGGIVAAVISSMSPDLIVNSNQGIAPWIPAAGLLLMAGIGTIAVRGKGGGRAPPPPSEPAEPRALDSQAGRLTPVMGWAAVGLTALTVILVVVGLSDRQCGVTASGWSDTVLWLALICGLAAGVLGIATLLLRRWLVALVSIPAPIIGFFGLVAAACLS